MAGEHGPQLLVGLRGQAAGPDLRDVGDPQQVLDATEFLQLTLVEHGDPIADILHVG